MSVKAINNSTYTWVEKIPEPLPGGFSHSRIVYISEAEPAAEKWVAKIATTEIRMYKVGLNIPHAEEVAYKVSKLFGWDTVPKSKVFHEQEIDYLGSPEKIAKYKPLADCFSRIKGIKTFTFQKFCEGKPLFSPTEKASILNHASYQKAYLLGMLLGSYDSRRDNILYDSNTKKLFLIDNEYQGMHEYDFKGILRDFSFDRFKKLRLNNSVLNDIRRADPKKLAEISEKYCEKGALLFELWGQELHSFHCAAQGNCSLETSWETILKNFEFMQREIETMQERGEPITLEALEYRIAAAYINEGAADEDFNLYFDDPFS